MPREQNIDSQKDKIEGVRENLYSRTFKEEDIIDDIPKKDYKVSGDWSNSEEKHAPSFISKLPMKKILISSVIFFGVAIVIATFVIFKGFNVFSADKIEFSISGPVSVAGGKETNLTVSIVNNNKQPIEAADLFIVYPEGAYPSINTVDVSPRVKYELGSITSGTTLNEQIPVVIFGAENSEKEIKFSLEFRFNGSSATLEKTENYVVTITSSPIDISLDILKEATAGQELELIANIKSNADSILEDVLFSIEYPFGFTFLDASPKPLYGSDTWEIGELTPGEERKIKIRGIVEGQNDEEKVFRLQIGKRNKKTGEAISTTYNSITEPIVVKQPFLGLEIILNKDSSPEYIGKEKRPVRGDIIWKNNLSTKILDVKVVVELSGAVLDKYKVRTPGDAFYQSFDNTILWDSNNSKEFKIVEPGQTGVLTFSIASLPLEGFTNPEVNITVNAEGNRISDTNVPEEIKASVSRNIKFESDLSIVPRAVYYVGPFTNTGPLPPRVEQETTYTIIWTVTNSSNEISSGQVRATLPPNVTWLGNRSPIKENITYNDVGGEVIWNLGKIAPGVGGALPVREVAFQVMLLPSISQISSLPPIISRTTITGEDTFTGTMVSETKQALNTRLSTDPYAADIFSTVQK
ncbi:MAG TPA: hypothetical protein ENI66_01060 [Candidatus Yonathbacteria bacterium]|nr:hypothetical protein [Candidatus Yonathbacteria bacterium]